MSLCQALSLTPALVAQELQMQACQIVDSCARWVIHLGRRLLQDLARRSRSIPNIRAEAAGTDMCYEADVCKLKHESMLCHLALLADLRVHRGNLLAISSSEAAAGAVWVSRFTPISTAPLPVPIQRTDSGRSRHGATAGFISGRSGVAPNSQNFSLRREARISTGNSAPPLNRHLRRG